MFLRIGFYGVSGVGKSTLIEQFCIKYQKVCYYIDGSSAISNIIELGKFKNLSYLEQSKIRIQSINYLNENFKNKYKHLLVSGHYIIEEEIIWTKADENFYNIIFFCKRDPFLIIKQRKKDYRKRPDLTFDKITNWQNSEEKLLSESCSKAKIKFCRLDLDNLDALKIEKKIIETISENSIKLVCNTIYQSGHKKIVTFDCDGTLNRDDSFSLLIKPRINSQDIKKIFNSYNKYCFDAFYEVSEFIRKESSNKFDYVFSKRVSINSRIIEIIETYSKMGFTYFIFISGGLPDIWKDSIEKVNLKSKIIIGGACFAKYGLIISNDIKGNLVKNLVSKKDCVISSFGNGLNDLEMLCESNFATIVYDKKPKQSLVRQISSRKKFNLVKLSDI